MYQHSGYHNTISACFMTFMIVIIISAEIGTLLDIHLAESLPLMRVIGRTNPNGNENPDIKIKSRAITSFVYY